MDSVKLFEDAIRAKGLVPRELRMEQNRVKWFLCDGTGEYDIVVYDREGKALALPSYAWPEEVNDVDVRSYPGGVSIDGRPAQRDSRLDLDFGEDVYASETWGLLGFIATDSVRWKDTCLNCRLWDAAEGQTEECIAAPPCRADRRKDGRNGYFGKMKD